MGGNLRKYMEQPQKQKLKISLVIPAHNEESSIRACLDAVQKNSRGLLHEIIVVDNASTDRTKEYAQRDGVTVVSEPRKGTGNARQSGFEHTSGDYVAFIDADTMMPEGWIDKIQDFFDSNPKAVCLSGPYRYHDGSSFRNFMLDCVWYMTAPLTYRIVGYMILGGNFVARRQALLDAGGFDRGITFYGDDTDTAQRLSKTGKVVFKMDFFMYSSSRRWQNEGFLKTNIVYALNFIWPVIFKRPFSRKSNDVRTLAK